MSIGMGREILVVLLLAAACGTPNNDTAGASGTDTQPGTTDSGGTTAGDPSSGGSQSNSTDSPTDGTGSGSDTVDTTDSTPTTSTTDSTTTTTTDSTTTTTDSTTTTTDTTDTDSSTTDTTTMGVDTTTSTTEPDDTTTSTTEPETSTTGDPPLPCGSVLKATIRDFAFSHPDFETYSGNTAYKGIVLPDLGPDKKPVYAHPGSTPQTSGPDNFAHWYNDVPGVNHTFQVDLPLTEVSPGLYQYADSTFFPIDGLGFGNEGQANNFAFTTEIHTTFSYKGGEIFTFIGDDDVWVFINNKLALDLGGLHPQLTDSVNLDAQAAALGITPGQSYAMDIFHAERHTNESNFRIDTTIACFVPQ